MPYIGNTIRAADDYRLIDDISSGFNGSATSFGLRVAGSAPVPFPKSPQQVLISVNGVIQEPDPTGASGFNLVGTNIVFSSAPTNGHAFFGIIYATADYLNAGGNFPSGSTGAPSLTFIGDEDTGIYRKGSGSVGFVSNSTEIANTDSNGITISSGNLILGDSAGASSDRVVLGASSDLSIYHDGSNSFIDDGGTGNLVIRSNTIAFESAPGSGESLAKFIQDGAVELYHDNEKVFYTRGDGVQVQNVNGDGILYVVGSEGNEAIVKLHADDGDDNADKFQIVSHASNYFAIQNFASGSFEDNLKAFGNGAVELYHNNTKKFETTSTGVHVDGELIIDGVVGDLKLNSSGAEIDFNRNGPCNIIMSGSGTFNILGGTPGSADTMASFVTNGAVELYHDNSKKLETISTGVTVTGDVNITDDLVINSSNAQQILRDFTSSSDSDISGLLSGSTFGTLLEAAPNGHHVIALRENDTSDSFAIVSGGGNFQTDNTYDKLVARFRSDGTINIPDNGIIKVGDDNDLQIYHDGNSRIDHNGGGVLVIRTQGTSEDIQLLSARDILLRPQGGEDGININGNGAVQLYYDNVKRFETDTDHVTVIGVNNNAAGVAYIKFKAANGSLRASIGKESAANGQLMINNRDNDSIVFKTSNTVRMSLTDSGHLEPQTDGAQDLGNSSQRWRDLYVSDLDLSNEARGGNDIDGTWGSYTIQEGHEDLFLINKRTGKRFKFNLIEVA